MDRNGYPHVHTSHTYFARNVDFIKEKDGHQSYAFSSSLHHSFVRTSHSFASCAALKQHVTPLVEPHSPFTLLLSTHQILNMQLISALLMVAAASVASAAAFAPYGWQRFTGHERFCDHGTHGDGGCEKNGKHTYCVRQHKP